MSSHYKKKRAVNLENAKIHAKSLEVNADRALGDCTKLSELHQLVKENPALQNLSEESIKLLKDDVLMMRDVKKTGAHPSNKACSLDYRTEVRGLNDKVSSSIISSVLKLDTRFARWLNAPVPQPSHFSLKAMLLTHSNLHGSVPPVPKILQRIPSSSICGRSLNYLSSGAALGLKVCC